jgi:hypothetical protein
VRRRILHSNPVTEYCGARDRDRTCLRRPSRSLGRILSPKPPEKVRHPFLSLRHSTKIISYLELRTGHKRGHFPAFPRSEKSRQSCQAVPMPLQFSRRVSVVTQSTSAPRRFTSPEYRDDARARKVRKMLPFSSTLEARLVVRRRERRQSWFNAREP